MEFQDDFIDDSEEESQSEAEHVEINENGFFVTEADAIMPVELKPAVNILPITNLTRSLISKVQSLILFGSSGIGATVPGTVYDLGEHLRGAISSFPSFVEETGMKARSQEYRLNRKYDLLKEKVDHAQALNRKLKTYLRQLQANLPKEGEDSNDRRQIHRNQAIADAKAASTALKKAILKLRDVHENVREMQTENASLEAELQKQLQPYRKKGKDEVTELRNSIIRGEVELASQHAAHKEQLEAGHALINEIAPTVEILERRLADMNKKIGAMRRTQPKRRVGPAPPLPEATSKGPPVVIPRVAFANRYK